MEKARCRRTKVINNMFWVGIILINLKYLCNISNYLIMPSMLESLIEVMYFACLLPSIINTNKNRVVSYSILLMAIMTYIFTGNSNLLVSFCTIIAIDTHDISKMLKILLKMNSIFILMHFIISLIYYDMGNIAIQSVVHSRGTRWSMGFKHPNTLALIIINLILMYVWLNWDVIRTKHIMCIAAVAAFLYSLTISRTAMITSVLLIVYISFRKHEIITRLKALLKYLFPTITFVILLAIILYPNNYYIINITDKILSKRLWIGWTWFEENGLSLLGQTVTSSHFSVLLFDCIYTQLLMNLGIIWVIIFSILLKCATKIVEDKDICLLIFFIIYGVTESTMLNIFYYIALVALVPVLEKISPPIYINKNSIKLVRS